LSDIVAALVTHGHGDHISCAKDILKNGIECFLPESAMTALNIKSHRLNCLKPMEQFQVDSWTILPFDTIHDVESLGFLIESKHKERLLYLVDSTYCKYRFVNLNFILIECNYILEILKENVANNFIDVALKERIMKNHFSLSHVIQFLQANDLSQCREIILLHLSSQNSDAAQMIREIKEATGITPKIATPGLTVELELYPY
jgi:phosphoribosyl 1,2-cyclic phosphodiesterase